MTEILVPHNHNGAAHMHDPYTERGARSVLRRFRDDFVKMLEHMLENEETFSESGGKTFLANSPLKRKVYVAAAMKTLGLITESSSENGSCVLKLTPRGHQQISNARAMGWLAS